MQEDKVEIPGEEDAQETVIDLDAPAPEQSLEEEKIDVEQTSENDSQSADASKESSEQSDVQASEQKKELDDYSDGVQKRIAKLTRKMREAERQKEEAITYAQTIKQQADRMKGHYENLGGHYTKELEGKVEAGTAAAKAFIPSKPVDGSIAFFDANKIPAMAATMPDKAQIIELTRLTGIPI